MRIHAIGEGDEPDVVADPVGNDDAECVASARGHGGQGQIDAGDLGADPRSEFAPAEFGPLPLAQAADPRITLTEMTRNPRPENTHIGNSGHVPDDYGSSGSRRSASSACPVDKPHVS